jgi:hypothetical protein
LLGVHSRYGLHTRAVTVYRDTLTRGFSHFITSMTAPVASGWSGCRVGLAPTGKRRLCTAHAKRGHWQAIFEALARCGKDGVTLSIDSTSIKAHRSASGGKGGSMNRRSAARAADGPRKSTR